MSQELDAQMQAAPAPATNPAVDAWRQLADLVSIANGAAPAISPRPSIPAGTASGFAASIHRAYRRGGQAYHQPNLNLEPEIPADAGTSKCAVALWEFFWQGCYSETAATTKVPASGSGSSNASSKDAKINKPETFNGERDKFADFVVQLHLVFNNEEAAFRNDNAKISYAGALLRGAAKKWFTPHVNQETGAIAFTSWAQFMKRFRASFQDSDEKTAAERMLLNLQQGTEPCASYHASFVSYMATLDWEENSQIATFRRGLRPEIKDLLVRRDLPDTFDEYVSLCIRLDNSWREREQDRQNSGVVSLGSPPDPPTTPTLAATQLPWGPTLVPWTSPRAAGALFPRRKGASGKPTTYACTVARTATLLVHARSLTVIIRGSSA
jgi:hypothetical protein